MLGVGSESSAESNAQNLGAFSIEFVTPLDPHCFTLMSLLKWRTRTVSATSC